MAKPRTCFTSLYIYLMKKLLFMSKICPFIASSLLYFCDWLDAANTFHMNNLMMHQKILG